MKAVGLVLLLAGVVTMLVEIYLGATTYHLSRSRDMNHFIIGMVAGVVVAIIGGLLVRRDAQ